MPEESKRLTTEEIWATALAVIGGLAVLVPLLVYSLLGQAKTEEGGDRSAPPVVVASGTGDPDAPEERVVDLPPSVSEAEWKNQLKEAQKQIDSLGSELDQAKSEAETNLRSAQRAWKQLKAAGEFGGENVE